jgi:predicted DNA-binding transcriptional regulator YafY
LLDGYRTRLTGLSADEAKALSLSGLPGPAAELGLGSVLAAAQLKIRAALPPALADQLDQVQSRFHLDAATWYGATGEVPFLPAVADAVWRGRALSVRYRRWKEPTDIDRRLEPYGMVLKAGRWYLVAGPGSARTYRVDQILDLAGLEDEFTIPARFDLAAYWQQFKAEFLDQLYPAEATVRLSPAALPHLSGPETDWVGRTGSVEPDGWTRAVLPVESTEFALRQFLALGPEIEVLDPPELRSRLAAAARATAAFY